MTDPTTPAAAEVTQAQAILERRHTGFWSAVDGLPFVAKALANGAQFNAYDSAENDDDDEDEDCEMHVCVGPVTDARFIVTVTGRSKANMIANAVTLASRHRLAAFPNPGEEA